MEDICTRADLERLLRDFYSQALEDPLLSHVFNDVVHMDLEAHLPVITDFWEKVLFNVGSYSGRTMEVHRRIHRRVPLTGAHFSRWLLLWYQALERGFAGPVADQAAAHANRMAAVFLRNLAERPTRRTLPLVPGRPHPT